MKFSNILGLSFLFASAINARSIDNLSNDDKANDDQYYLCYVNNKHGEYRVFSAGKNQKRQASQIFVENLVDEINALILDNKDTYQDPEKLEEIEEAAQLKKRAEETAATYNESDYVYPISSVNDRVVLYAYLSRTLADQLPSRFDDVLECLPDEATFRKFHSNYNVDEILAETRWKNLAVRENADQHLSLISQGKVDQSSGHYDSNYYYPATAGKDVDLVFLDGSFNFAYSEFSNKERTAKCAGIVRNGRVSTDVSGGCDIDRDVYHGEATSVTAAGLTHGVASRANVYGVAVPTDSNGYFSNSDILGGVQYIYENLVRPYRTVINFSLGGGSQKNSQYFRQFNQLIDKIAEKGGIVVAAAGNESKDLDSYYYEMIPCELDNAICVGGIDNDKKRNDDIYTLVYFSNYGKNVDVYAPSNVKVDILKNGKVTLEDINGTSFSCPIVAGLIATIIGENTDVKYTRKAILDKLYENGKDQTFTVKKGSIGILANNGKRIVYSGEKITPRTTTTTRRTTTTTRRTTTTTTTRRTTTTTRSRTTTTTRPQPTQAYACPGEKSGYSCCKNCNAWYTDGDGNSWGLEGFRICSIKYSCKY